MWKPMNRQWQRELPGRIIEKTSPEALEIITDELARVAVFNNNEEREKALRAIRDQFRTPSSRVVEAKADPARSPPNRGPG